MKKLIAANWKMNKTVSEAGEYCRELKKSRTKNDVIIFPSFISLPFANSLLGRERCGAQDVFFEGSGSFTGEVSPKMVKEVADYVIIGHSERRALGESDQMLNKKAVASQKAGLKIIFCIGEKKGEDRNFLFKKQISAGLAGVEDVIIAYEPVWAIGTGKTPTKEEIKEAVEFIKSLKNVKVLYGGSVSEKNAKKFLSVCDGLLVGGASLDIAKFLEIANS